MCVPMEPESSRSGPLGPIVVSWANGALALGPLYPLRPLGPGGIAKGLNALCHVLKVLRNFMEGFDATGSDVLAALLLWPYRFDDDKQRQVRRILQRKELLAAQAP